MPLLTTDKGGHKQKIYRKDNTENIHKKYDLKNGAVLVLDRSNSINNKQFIIQKEGNIYLNITVVMKDKLSSC